MGFTFFSYGYASHSIPIVGEIPMEIPFYIALDPQTSIVDFVVEFIRFFGGKSQEPMFSAC